MHPTVGHFRPKSLLEIGTWLLSCLPEVAFQQTKLILVICDANMTSLYCAIANRMQLICFLPIHYIPHYTQGLGSVEILCGKTQVCFTWFESARAMPCCPNANESIPMDWSYIKIASLAPWQSYYYILPTTQPWTIGMYQSYESYDTTCCIIILNYVI